MTGRVKSAKPGENVTVKVVCSDSDVMRGFVLCSAALPCHAATLFVAQIALVELTEQVRTTYWYSSTHVQHATSRT